MNRVGTRIMVVAVLALALALALSACEPVPEETPVAEEPLPEEGPLPEEPEPEELADLPDEVEEAAKEALSEETGIAVEDMEVVDAHTADWPDACLGLVEPDEVCAQVITPGWQVLILAEGEEYVLRTDEDGEQVRIDQ